MEAQPDFDARDVARTVAIAVSTLHNRTLSSSDSCNDETPLVSDARLNKDTMDINNSTVQTDKEPLQKKRVSRWKINCGYIPARYVLTLMGFLGFCNVYALRVNLSVALVAMVNSTSSHNVSGCPVIGNTSEAKDVSAGKFPWSSKDQGAILGSFFYGYVLTQIPGGRMAEIFGGKWLFGIGVLCTSIFTLLTPVAAEYHMSALIAIRVLEGLGEGVTFPAMHAMLGRWLPKFERSLLSTIIYSGAQIGTVVSMPISGLLCASDFFGGWPSVFYVFGTLGCIWFVFWTWLVHEKPEQHPRISKAEILLIQSSTMKEDLNKEKPNIPWSAILTSVPVWALVFTHFGQNWGFYTLLTELPTYFSTILHFNITSNGFLSALPYLLQAICSWIISYFADRIRQKRIATISVIRKVCNSVGFFAAAACFLGVNLSGCNQYAAVAFVILAMGFNGATYSGFMVTHVDMSPTFAGTLMGITNGFANLTGFLAPAVVGALTDGNETLGQWQIVFYIAVAVYIVSGVLFIVCGSAQLQPWDPCESQNISTSHDTNKDKDSDVDGT